MTVHPARYRVGCSFDHDFIGSYYSVRRFVRHFAEASANPADVDRYGWTGREFDVEIGLQYNRARYYDPAIGRWISRDPLGFGAGDSNLYRYVNNRSTVATDPSGFAPIQLVKTNDGRYQIKNVNGYYTFKGAKIKDGEAVVHKNLAGSILMYTGIGLENKKGDESVLTNGMAFVLRNRDKADSFTGVFKPQFLQLARATFFDKAGKEVLLGKKLLRSSQGTEHDRSLFEPGKWFADTYVTATNPFYTEAGPTYRDENTLIMFDNPRVGKFTTIVEGKNKNVVKESTSLFQRAQFQFRTFVFRKERVFAQVDWNINFTYNATNSRWAGKYGKVEIKRLKGLKVVDEQLYPKVGGKFQGLLADRKDRVFIRSGLYFDTGKKGYFPRYFFLGSSK